MKLSSYLETGQYDLFVALGFPNALDAMRLETCLAYSLWAFAVRLSRVSSSRAHLIFLDVASPQILSKADDLTDEGELQARPEGVQIDIDKSAVVIEKLDVPRPADPYAAMLQECVVRSLYHDFLKVH